MAKYAGAGFLLLVVAVLLAAGEGTAGLPPGRDARSAAPADAACPTTVPGGVAPDGVVVGYAGLSGAFPFVQDVNGGVEQAAACLGVRLVVVDNGEDAERAAAAAETLVARGVDVAISVPPGAEAAEAACAPFEAAGVPVVAVGAAPSCGVPFGADDERAGRLAGVRLATLATARWGGEVDALVVLGLPEKGRLPLAGPAAAVRAEAAVAGARAGLPALTDDRIVRAAGDGTVEGSRAATAEVLGRLEDAERILVLAMDDPGAAGALRAVEEAGMGDRALVAGQGATIEARDALCGGSRAFAGSVAFFPERYGERLVPLAIGLARGVATPSAVATDHVWIDAANVGRYYPGECDGAGVPTPSA